MNKENIKGLFNVFAGQLQERAGQLLGNKDQQAKGLIRQVIGRAESAIGNIRDSVPKKVEAAQTVSDRTDPRVLFDESAKLFNR